jgi:hypothetical protein
MPVEHVCNWYQMNMTMKGNFITGLSVDPGFVDAAVY